MKVKLKIDQPHSVPDEEQPKLNLGAGLSLPQEEKNNGDGSFDSA